MKYYSLLLVIFIIYLAYPVHGNEKVSLDNLTILNNLTEQIIQRVVGRIDLKEFERIHIKNVEPNDKNRWFIENWFIDILNKLGYDSIYLHRDKFSDTTITQLETNPITVFEFKIIHLNVKYVGENKFGRNSSIDRKIFVELWINIFNFSNGKVYWSGNIRKDYSDKIKRDKIPALQNSNLVFTQAPIPPTAGFKKLIEPIFIMGLTGVIIYLFYSFRSK